MITIIARLTNTLRKVNGSPSRRKIFRESPLLMTADLAKKMCASSSLFAFSGEYWIRNFSEFKNLPISNPLLMASINATEG
jgi:hypothetical protein